jgi:hypothetical protein
MNSMTARTDQATVLIVDDTPENLMRRRIGVIEKNIARFMFPDALATLRRVRSGTPQLH